MMSFHPDKPYNNLPLLPPPGVLETPVVLKAALGASRSLAELKAATGYLPRPDILTHLIGLLEAQASSEIENVVTTHDEIFRADGTLEGIDNPAVKEVLRYRDALWLGMKELKARQPLCTNLYVRLMQTLRYSQEGLRQIPGTQLRNQSTGEVVYTPPVGEAVLREKLANLDRFIHEEIGSGIDPLIRMAVAHYQFEAIHPFHDGNGRTGRLLCVLQLVESGLLREPILFFSRYILQNRTRYYGLLRGVTAENAWEPWLVFMLEGIEDTAMHTLGKIQGIQSLGLELEEAVRKYLPKSVSAKEWALVMIEKPYFRIADFESLAGRQTVSKHLDTLAEKQILVAIKSKKENIYYIPSMLSLLQGRMSNPST